MINLRRIRPTRHTLAALIGLLWALSFGAVRDFVWGDLYRGMIHLRDLSRLTRALVWLGFLLLFLMVGALLFNDLWRALFPLRAMLNAPAGRGALLPTALVPVTLFMLAVSWSYILTGALHSHPALRLFTLLLYLLFIIGWMNGTNLANLSSEGGVSWHPLLQGGTIAVVPLLFALRWRRVARPALEFSLLLLAVSATFAIAQSRELTSEQLLGIPVILAKLELNVGILQGLILPFLLLLGLDIANFVRQVAGWSTAAVAERLPEQAPRLLLLLLLGWRLSGVLVEGWERIEISSLQEQLPAYAGALALPLIPLLLFGAMSRLAGRGGSRPPEEEEIAASAEKGALPILLLFVGLQLLVTLLLVLALALPSIPPLVALRDLILLFADLANEQITPLWHLLLGPLALAAGLWLAARGRLVSGLYPAIFGGVHLWYELVRPGRPLAALSWRGPEPEDFWWVLLLAGAALLALLRGRLSRERATGLLFLVLASALLRESDFIEDPFSPFFSFAGVAFIAFGILWDSLTIGAWANQGTPALPRISRIFLYVGYVLLSVTIINWSLVAHDLGSLDMLTGRAALVGLDRFGKPLLYAIFATLLLTGGTGPSLTEERAGDAQAKESI